MKMIVGLGNPGKEYQNTRHNYGFKILDWLAQMQQADFSDDKKSQASIAKTEIGGENTLLVKPQTFMNNSGQAVSEISKYFKIKPRDILIIYDDNDLNFGDIRTTGNSSAGHRGAESVFTELGTKDIGRIRLGINNGSAIPTENFVLQDFTEQELASLEINKERAVKEILRWIKPGLLSG